MQIGLCTISNTEARVETVLKQAGAAGYDGIEIWGKDHVGDGSRERCRAIADRAAELDLDVFVYGSYLRPGVDEYEDSVEQELSIAENLGADRIRIWAGDQEYDDCSDTHWTDVVTDLQDLTERAAKAGLEVTVERHAGTVTNTLQGARQLIETIDDEHCRLNYQPIFTVHAEQLLEEAAVLAPLSNNVHLQAVPTQGGDDRCLLSDAYFDVEAVLAPFLDGEFDGSVNVEFVPPDMPYMEAIEANQRYLESICS